MFKNESLEGIVIRLISVAVGCYLALPIADHVSAFFMHFLPDWFNYFLPMLIGYGLTGFFFGFGLWLAFKQTAKQVIVLSPLFLLLAIWVQSYINFSNDGDSGSFSPWKILGWLLTTPRGFYLLVVLPGVAFMTIRYFSAKQIGTDSLMENTEALNMRRAHEEKHARYIQKTIRENQAEKAAQLQNKIFSYLKNSFSGLWAGRDVGGKMVSVALILTAVSISMNWFTIGHVYDFGPVSLAVIPFEQCSICPWLDFLIFGLCWCYPFLMIIKNKAIAFKQGMLCAIVSMLWIFWSFFKMFQANEYKVRSSDFWLSPEIGVWLALMASLLFAAGVLTSARIAQFNK